MHTALTCTRKLKGNIGDKIGTHAYLHVDVYLHLHVILRLHVSGVVTLQLSITGP